jgi:uncharacterized repeat protein (TIGR01451 family)
MFETMTALSAGLTLVLMAVIRANSVSPWTMVTDHAAFSPRDTANGAVFLGKMWLSHGYPEGVADLWSSSDGVTWDKVLDFTPYPLYCDLTVFDGKLWAVGGSVWSSEDGVNWTQVLDFDSRPFPWANNAVAFDGKLWALGDGPEVWSSTDGANWICATRNAPYGNRAAPAVTVFDGKMWLMGGSTPAPGKGYSDPNGLGYPDIDMNNDVWSSTDGVNWTRVTAHAPWTGRMWFETQSYAGRLWIVGGYDNDSYQNLGDTWYSTDGVNWHQATQSSAGWSPRHYPTTFVFDNSLWITAGNSWPFQNDVWKMTATPVIATTVNVVPSVSPAAFGQAVTFTATVAPDGATGTVTFKSEAGTLGTADVSSGVATLTTAAMAAGAHTVTASYAGDTDYASAIGSTAVAVDAPSAPTISQTFFTSSIPLNRTATLTFQISNSNVAASLTGIAFTNALPDGLIVATPNGLTGGCGSGTISASSGGSTISLSDAVIAPMNSCTFSVDVLAITAGTKDNATSAVSSAEAGSGNVASASIDVIAPPSLAMTFHDPSVLLHSTTSLSFTLSNPAINRVPLTGVGFLDNLPAGLVIANPNGLSASCGDATVAANPGSSALSISGATLPPNSTCTISLNVIAVAAGTQLNATGAVTSTDGGDGPGASASLEVLGADLTIAKGHTGDFDQGATGKTYTITVRNIGVLPTSGEVMVVDQLPVGLTATAISGTEWACTLSPLRCLRTDPLAVGGVAPPITVTVNVAGNATTLTNVAIVSGGGEGRTDNDTASDLTNIHAVTLAAPASMTATAVSTSEVDLSWTAVQNAVAYDVFRASGGSGYSLIGSSTTITYPDLQVSAGTSYVYQVRAIDGSGSAGPPSNVDLATTIFFSDDPLIPQVTTIRAAHLSELRVAVQSVLTCAGSGTGTFTSVPSPGALIEARDINDLRMNLDAARSVLGLPALLYSDPTINAGDTVKAAHVQELRAGVK